LLFRPDYDRAEPCHSIDFSRVNPATGPVYVEGAEPGDGLLIHRAETQTKIVPVENSSIAHFNDKIHFHVEPMIGVIGTAPAGEDVPTGHPGDHGGNIDNHMITKGAIVYLPVNVAGALFALGDVHASMGDGEIGGTGIEIAGEVEATLSVLKGKSIPRPMVETADSWYTVAADHDTQTAIRVACEDMQDLLVGNWDLTQTDAYLLMSVAGDVQMCQCCNPSPIEVISRFHMPKIENMPRLID
jgi:amidase